MKTFTDVVRLETVPLVYGLELHHKRKIKENEQMDEFFQNVTQSWKEIGEGHDSYPEERLNIHHDHIWQQWRFDKVSWNFSVVTADDVK